jgi:hypothetical protein
MRPLLFHTHTISITYIAQLGNRKAAKKTAKGEEGYEACIESVRKIFERFSEGGIVTVPNQAICYSNGAGPGGL